MRRLCAGVPHRPGLLFEVVARKATAYAWVTRVWDDGIDKTLLSNLPYYADHGYSLQSKSSYKKSTRIYWGYTKFARLKMVGKETTAKIALDDITPVDMALKLGIYVMWTHDLEDCCCDGRIKKKLQFSKLLCSYCYHKRLN